MMTSNILIRIFRLFDRFKEERMGQIELIFRNSHQVRLLRNQSI
jgi:hypothetical protein